VRQTRQTPPHRTPETQASAEEQGGEGMNGLNHLPTWRGAFPFCIDADFFNEILVGTLGEIYKNYIRLHRSSLKFSAKFVQCFSIFLFLMF
jgi:hypothetical protein